MGSICVSAFRASLATILVLAAFGAPQTHADVWTFRDGRGVSHFSLTPKPGWRCLDPGTSAMATASVGSFDALIRKYAAEQAVDPTLVKALIRAESGFDPDAKSLRGAHGLMQLTLPTARAHGVANVYDPGQNIRGGVRHLRA